MVNKNTKSARKNFFDIKEILMHGVSEVREYELPAGKVLYRALSELELESCEGILLKNIRDPATKEYVFASVENNELSELNQNIDEIELDESEVKNVINSDIDYIELLDAFAKFNIHTVYLSIRDFTDDFKESDLIKLNGIRDFAAEIQRISGKTPEMIDDIADFRE